jgi:hypothetical protein
MPFSGLRSRMSTKEEERNGYTFGPTYVQYCIPFGSTGCRSHAVPYLLQEPSVRRLCRRVQLLGHLCKREKRPRFQTTRLRNNMSRCNGIPVFMVKANRDQSDGFGPFYYWPCKVRLSTDLPERYAKWPEFLGSALLISLVAINVLCFCQPELQTCARISAPVNASHAMDR